MKKRQKEINYQEEYLKQNDYIKSLFIFLLCVLILLVFVSVAKATPSQQWLDDECLENNYTFSQCQDFSTSFETNFTDTISNETQLIEDLQQNVTDRINNIENTHKSNISTIMSNFDNYLTSTEVKKFNDSEPIQQNTKQIQNLKASFQKFTGNTTSDPFDFSKVIDTQLQLKTAQQVKQQLDTIFSDDEETKDTLNLSAYALKSDIPTNYITQDQLSQQTNTSNNKLVYTLMFLVFALFLAVIFLYFKELPKLQETIEYLQQAENKRVQLEDSVPKDSKATSGGTSNATRIN